MDLRSRQAAAFGHWTSSLCEQVHDLLAERKVAVERITGAAASRDPASVHQHNAAVSLLRDVDCKLTELQKARFAGDPNVPKPKGIYP